MKITLRPKGATDSSSDVVLADGADRADDNVRGPARAEISVSIAVQQSTGIGAAATTFYSRDNRSGSYSFSASRRFATVEACSRFILLHGSECPAEGTLIFDFGDGGAHLLLLGVVIRQIGPMTQTGLHVSTRYACQFSSAVEADEDDVGDVIEEEDPDDDTTRINVGADTSVSGWGWDVYNLTGELRYLPTAAIENYGDVPIDVYRRYRVASYPNNISYSIPLAIGSYTVKLHMCAHFDETYVVDIKFMGSNVGSDYNIKAAAGGVMKAVIFQWTHTHEGGNFAITITPNGAGRFGTLCGIEIINNS